MVTVVCLHQHGSALQHLPRQAAQLYNNHAHSMFRALKHMRALSGIFRHLQLAISAHSQHLQQSHRPKLVAKPNAFRLVPWVTKPQAVLPPPCRPQRGMQPASGTLPATAHPALHGVQNWLQTLQLVDMPLLHMLLHPVGSHQAACRARHSVLMHHPCSRTSMIRLNLVHGVT